MGGCWPTPDQELLLRAALLRGADAIGAWEAWISRVDVDHLDPASDRLLPQLYQNLRDHGIQHPSMARLKGVYRYHWSKNQVLFHRIADVLRCLHEAGVRTMLLKGAALATLYYKNPGLRPMLDFDFLVPADQVDLAFSVLEARGWTGADEWPPHARSFRDKGRREFDLHWHAIAECAWPEADTEFWRDAVPAEVLGVPTLALGPSDQLLHVCVHGAKWNEWVAPIRWVADAMVVVSSPAGVDWDGLASRTRALRMGLPMADTLAYLRDALGAPVPARVLDEVRRLPSTLAERVDYRARTCRPDLMGPVLTLWTTYKDYAEKAASAGLRPGVADFPRYLQRAWKVDSGWQVPFYAVSKAGRRMVNALRTRAARAELEAPRSRMRGGRT
jgi:hypothetical protein